MTGVGYFGYEVFTRLSLVNGIGNRALENYNKNMLPMTNTTCASLGPRMPNDHDPIYPCNLIGPIQRNISYPSFPAICLQAIIDVCNKDDGWGGPGPMIGFVFPVLGGAVAIVGLVFLISDLRKDREYYHSLQPSAHELKTELRELQQRKKSLEQQLKNDIYFKRIAFVSGLSDLNLSTGCFRSAAPITLFSQDARYEKNLVKEIISFAGLAEPDLEEAKESERHRLG